MRHLALVLAACSSAPPPSAPLSQHVPPGPASRCADTIARVSTPGPELGYVISNDTLVRHALDEHRFAFQRCFHDHASRDGRVLLAMKLKKGHPFDVHITGFDVAVDRCLCDALFEIHFAEVDEGEVRYPLYFHM